MSVVQYDPFARGPFPVGVRTLSARDATRDRVFPCEVWYPATALYAGQDLAPATQDAFTVPAAGTTRSQSAVRDADAHPGAHPLILYSHPSGTHRRAATFLCTHLASHGYVVAAMDHSEVVTPALARKPDETKEQTAARIEQVIANRVPDVRLLLDHMLGPAMLDSEARPDPEHVALIGHSFGGWTVLATADVEPRIQAIVALAPGGASKRKPGILPTALAFAWGRDVPTLYLVAEDDTFTPLDGMHELYERTPATKRMFILRHADHCHFMDHVEESHEAVRAMPAIGELSWIARDVRPIGELCSGDEAQRFVCGLTLAHVDATLRGLAEARRFWEQDIVAALAARGVDARAAGQLR
jgi:dienelactone hydrolase